MRSRLQQSSIARVTFLIRACSSTLILSSLVLVTLVIIVSDHATAAQKTGRDVYYNTLAPVSGPWAPQLSNADYPTQYGESRLIVWMVAQQHLYWSGLVAGALMLVTLLEVWAILSRRKPSAEQTDQWAYDILRIVTGGFSVAALLGAALGACLLVLYPDLTLYLVRIFRPTVLIYAAMAVGLTLLTYSYYYTWWFWNQGALKYLHSCLGVLANMVATTMVMLANGWSSFMLSPAGVDHGGRFLGNVWHALHTATWNAFSIHRLLSHLILASAVLASYAAYQALGSKTGKKWEEAEQRTYLCLLVLAGAFFVLQFQGYQLVREIYAYRQQMGITLLGGLLAWLGQVRALLVAGLFLGLNYYVWQRISVRGRGKGDESFRKYVFLILALCAAVYITPHTMVMTKKELFQVGGQQHPVVGNYGVESAKQTAVNMMILVTIGSWYLWKRTGVTLTPKQVPWAGPITAGVFLAAAINLLFSGIYGYYIPANVRVGVLTSSVAMPFMVLGYVLLVTRGWSDQRIEGPQVLRQFPLMKQWIVFPLAFLVTWLMGLGGYLRSSVRLFWHISEIVRDESPWAFTQSIGFVTNVISLNALLFWSGLLLLFWLAGARGHEDVRQAVTAHLADTSQMERADIHP